MLKKIPIGLQDFRKIIENGFLYVDKTAYIYLTAWETIQIWYLPTQLLPFPA